MPQDIKRPPSSSIGVNSGRSGPHRAIRSSACTRTLGPEQFLVVLNFGSAPIDYTLPGGLEAGDLMLSNLPSTEQNTSQLHPAGWDARVYKLN